MLKTPPTEVGDSRGASTDGSRNGSPGKCVRPTRSRPAFLLALGKGGLPDAVEIDGRPFQRVETFKHDSWAGTGLYLDHHGVPAVCKFNRRQSLFGFPMGWLGRWLARREREILVRLADMRGVPDPLGKVAIRGKAQANAVAREFIPGRPLAPSDRFDEAFFQELRRLLGEVHRHGVAYNDLHKRENILVGDDGRPYLIDFQISLHVPPSDRRRQWLFGGLLRRCQDSDEYHLLKHEVRQSQVTRWTEADLDRRRPIWVRWHRWLAVPFRQCRRRLLTAIGVRSGSGHAETEVAPEVAFRR